MKQRLLTALIGVPLTILVIVFSHTLVWEAAVLLFTIVGIYEALKCVGLKNNIYISMLSYLYGVCAVIFSYNTYEFMYYITSCYVILILGACVFFKNKIPFNDIAALSVISVYVVNGMFSLIALRRTASIGLFLIFFIFIGAWITDGFAYFVGRAFGKHKLIPEISPKKTVEGAIGGIVFGVISYLIFGFIISYFFKYQVNYFALTVVGIVVSLFSMLGDLILSCLKRAYNIKDFGNLLPGHGGVLDRFDSIFSISPILLMAVSLNAGDVFYLIK